MGPGMVYFTNPLTVHLESKRIPGIPENEDGGRELLQLYLNYEGKRNLNEKK